MIYIYISIKNDIVMNFHLLSPLSKLRLLVPDILVRRNVGVEKCLSSRNSYWYMTQLFLKHSSFLGPLTFSCEYQTLAKCRLCSPNSGPSHVLSRISRKMKENRAPLSHPVLFPLSDTGLVFTMKYLKIPFLWNSVHSHSFPGLSFLPDDMSMIPK